MLLNILLCLSSFAFPSQSPALYLPHPIPMSTPSQCPSCPHNHSSTLCPYRTPFLSRSSLSVLISVPLPRHPHLYPCPLLSVSILPCSHAHLNSNLKSISMPFPFLSPSLPLFPHSAPSYVTHPSLHLYPHSILIPFTSLSSSHPIPPHPYPIPFSFLSPSLSSSLPTPSLSLSCLHSRPLLHSTSIFTCNLLVFLRLRKTVVLHGVESKDQD